ncbi:secreted frizzled-related protein 1/5 precursor [Saccoglossus kowalevskii]|uniref:Secreted frizzled-related protein 1 n=1 Tax=Saccoglossus kowalevskii TaxID=10224 RepID=D1LXE0_SACKO|nr:secreted frizzled-related protein 1/5 precursor [Saccoglossus kowalevskii]ACY92646.1 SFRP1/5 [Saccoglossus kowalevskii]
MIMVPSALRACFLVCVLAQVDMSWTYAMDLSGRITKPMCVSIPAGMGLCQNIGYTQMRMPNLLDHDSMGEVQQQAASWVPLVQKGCHPETRLFLCSLFAPVCLDRPIFPCRSLCEKVRDSCTPVMLEYGFPWPEMLYCDKLPLDNDLCIAPHMSNGSTETNGGGGEVVPEGDKEDDSEEKGGTCEQCHQDASRDVLLEQYCEADFVVKTRITESKKTRGDMKFVSNKKKRKFYNKGGLKKKDMQEMSLYVEDGGRCNCDVIEPGKVTYLIMGKQMDKKLVITFAMPWKKSRDFRRATRMFKGLQCDDSRKRL